MYATPKIRYLPIGKILEWQGRKLVQTEKPMLFKDYGFGVHCIIASARLGKSVLAKIIYVQASKYRPIVVFDYGTEHRDSRFPNFYSNGKIRGISDLKIYKNIGFRISDFQHILDWQVMGFREFSATYMQILARNTGVHQDDPERFLQILLELPTEWHNLNSFNDKFGYELPSPISPQVKAPMLQRYYALKESNLFVSPDIKNKLNYFDFGQELFQHKHILISLGINVEVDLWKAQVMVGKILEQLYGKDGKNFSRYQKCYGYAPMLVLEEADKLAPEIRETATEPVPSSLFWLMNYVIKFQKYGPALLFIAQDPNILNSTIHGNALSNIYGQCPETSRRDILDITSGLRWDLDTNYRQFVYQTKDKRRTIFVPDSPPCIA